MVRDHIIGLMVIVIQDNGKTIWEKVMVNFGGQMAIIILVNGNLIKGKEKV